MQHPISLARMYMYFASYVIPISSSILQYIGITEPYQATNTLNPLLVTEERYVSTYISRLTSLFTMSRTVQTKPLFPDE